MFFVNTLLIRGQKYDVSLGFPTIYSDFRARQNCYFKYYHEIEGNYRV